MKTFSVQRYGYYNHYPQGLTMAEAKRVLVDESMAEAKRCRATYGRAVRHRITECRIDITLARDKDSALWCRIFIVED